jgi:hypothetical protein
VLVLGCGDVGLRFARTCAARLRVFGTVRRPEAAAAVRAAGAVPIVADLDGAATTRRLRGLAPRILHSVPPPAAGDDDPRTRRALAALPAARTWVYLGTTGVYGDRRGAWTDEAAPIAPATDRARRRAAAERRLRRHARQRARCAARAPRPAVRVALLRVPGIYAADRLPLERLRRGTPALAEADDGYSNHVHADDLARVAFAALWRARGVRTVNAVDDSAITMGAWFDAVADAHGLPRPPRLPRAALQAAVSPALWSFMAESRRLRNTRLKRELRVRLRWPTVLAFLGGGPTATDPPPPG